MVFETDLLQLKAVEVKGSHEGMNWWWYILTLIKRTDSKTNQKPSTWKSEDWRTQILFWIAINHKA